MSAAAVNSQGGFAIPRWARAALALVNLSLGVWTRNPRLSGDRLRFRRWPHYWTGYTFKDIAGTNNEYDTLLFLSDGGHHENLGLTALVERGCRLVICVDAGRDPEYTCVDLARAATLLRLDQHWEIDVTDTKLALLRPSGPSGGVRDRTPASPILVAQLYRAAGTEPEKRCTVVYVKAALTHDLPLEVLRYADSHPSFPHESTANQFFGEAQFEAYRELGLLLAAEVAKTLDENADWAEVLKDSEAHPVVLAGVGE